MLDEKAAEGRVVPDELRFVREPVPHVRNQHRLDLPAVKLEHRAHAVRVIDVDPAIVLAMRQMNGNSDLLRVVDRGVGALLGVVSLGFARYCVPGSNASTSTTPIGPPCGSTINGGRYTPAQRLRHRAEEAPTHALDHLNSDGDLESPHSAPPCRSVG